MDAATHALTSYALARGLFPRRGWTVAVGMIAAGCIADLDAASVFFGPKAYLAVHYKYAHSILGAIAIAVLACILTRFLSPNRTQPVKVILLATSVAAFGHILLDLFQSDGEMLLWPFRPMRFAADFIPSVDPWILVILLGGIVLPELFRMVGSEIGAKSRSPRGRNGALVAIVLIIVYITGRGVLRGNSVALMDARSYRGESPRRLGSFPDTLSLFTWHGIVETESMICLVDVPVGPGSKFDAESANCQHKPEYSADLAAAQRSKAAQEFLEVARFPKATVERTSDGAEVEIRALRDQVLPGSRYRLAVRVAVDHRGRVTSDELVWARDLRGR